ncbi:MAG: sarcosine oxidase subunit gamma [Pseudomonadota bacterium]
MSDLKPLNALGGNAPKTEAIGAVTFTEVPELALASVAARRGAKEKCADLLAGLLGNAAPAPGHAVLAEPFSAVWMAENQWMVGAHFDSHEDIAFQLAKTFGPYASITEQSDGWVTIDVSGDGTVDLLERLSAARVRRMKAGMAHRTSIHQMSCFLLCGAPGAFYRVLGPRSSVGSLWHALCQAALSVR